MIDPLDGTNNFAIGFPVFSVSITLLYKREPVLGVIYEPMVNLAKGDIDGIILYNSEGDDLYSGILMVKEAGGIVVDFQGNEFTGMSSEPYLIACHPDHKHHFMQMVKEGLRPQLASV